MKNAILGFIALLILSACQAATPPTDTPPASDVTNFEECVAAGNPVMESYPRQCRHGNRTFTEVINDTEGNCKISGGTWLADSNECENIPEEKCEELGGTYNECASACRNDPTAEICTLQCVIVCQF